MDKIRLNIIITLIVIFVLAALYSFLKKKDYTFLVSECDAKINSILEKHGIDTDNPGKIAQKKISGFRAQAIFLEKSFYISAKQNTKKLTTELSSAISGLPLVSIGKIQKKKAPKEQLITLEFYYKHLLLYRLILKQKRVTAKIAIVLDDWGYNDQLFKEALKLDSPITFAILPELPYSAEIAAALHKHGYEFILHLPLEPHNSSAQTLEKNTILTTMSQKEIQDILNRHIASLPGLKGVNNHMGSKATEDRQTMLYVLEILKAKRLYFLDSYTSNKSILESVTGETGVPFYKRDIFIDDKYDSSSIKNELIKAKDLAKTRGYVIVIGHAKPLTIAALKELIPKFEKEGCAFVYVSDLASLNSANK